MFKTYKLEKNHHLQFFHNLEGETAHQLTFCPLFAPSKVDKLPGVNGFAKLCNNRDKLLPPSETHQSVNI